MNFLWNITVVLLCVGPALGEYKRWISDTNFDNPANWNAKRVPCGNDVVIFPEEIPVVYMQMNTSIKELVLPKIGELIMGLNSELRFTDQPSADCPDFGGDLEFTALQPEPWLDPSSWCATSTERGECDVTTMRLDVEQVPCAFDDVIFPRDHLYYVDLTDAPSNLTMKSLKVAGYPFSTSKVRTLMKSPIFQNIFLTGSIPTPLEVTRKSCEHIAGCPCGNDRPEMSSVICKHVEKSCRRPKCKDTILPVGACCKMCGAVFNITRGYGFSLADFQKLINDRFFSETDTGVNMTSSLTSEGWLQMVLTDLTGSLSAAMAQQIKADIDYDIANGGHRYAINGVQLSLASGAPIGPDTSAHSGSEMGGGSIAGIFFAVIIAILFIAAVVVIFVYRRQGKPLPTPQLPSMPKLPPMPRLPFNMPRLPAMPRLFRRQGRYVERMDQPQTAAHIDPGFANPLYDTSPFDDGNGMVKEMELMEASLEVQPTFDAQDGGFNNPLYGSGRGAMFSDPTEPSDEPKMTDASTVEPSSPTATPDTTAGTTTAIVIDTHGDGPPDSTI